MSMQLWTLAEPIGPLLTILARQTVAVDRFTLFRVIFGDGENYQVAVFSAGFGGFALGATPTAVANMTAVTNANGPMPLALAVKIGEQTW